VQPSSAGTEASAPPATASNLGTSMPGHDHHTSHPQTAQPGICNACQVPGQPCSATQATAVPPQLSILCTAALGLAHGSHLEARLAAAALLAITGQHPQAGGPWYGQSHGLGHAPVNGVSTCSNISKHQQQQKPSLLEQRVHLGTAARQWQAMLDGVEWGRHVVVHELQVSEGCCSCSGHPQAWMSAVFLSHLVMTVCHALRQSTLLS
jgi:hypothetical protein